MVEITFELLKKWVVHGIQEYTFKDLMQEFVEEDTRVRFLEHNQPFNSKIWYHESEIPRKISESTVMTRMHFSFPKSARLQTKVFAKIFPKSEISKNRGLAFFRKISDSRFWENFETQEISVR